MTLDGKAPPMFAGTSDPDYQAMLRAIEAELRILRAWLVATRVSDPTPEQRAFLEPHGFRPVARDTWARGL